MKPQAAHVVSVPFSRPATIAGGPLLLLAMVLVVTAGGLSATTTIRPVSQAPVLAVLALPVHVAACPRASLDDECGTEPVQTFWVNTDAGSSEVVRFDEALLNLPPPTC
tara:strand:- start:345 stop:671 length:327 start_codon:yes stop_codon:yes gene_type:complete